MNKLLLVIALVVTLSHSITAQTETPTPAGETNEAREARIREELKVLKARIDYLNAIKGAAGSSDITAATSGGSTTFKQGELPNLETVSLSYEALQEIAQLIDQELKPTVSQYRALVIHHSDDFDALIRYRLYREQVRLTLANYEVVVKGIEEEANRGNRVGLRDLSRPRSVARGGEALVTALSAPAIATSAIKSVAELISLFRTEQTIIQSTDVVKKDSLGTVVAGIFLKANPNLVVYHPEQFVAEYEIGASDPDSLYSQTARINAAEAYLNYFLAETARLPAAERESLPLSRIIAQATLLQGQIRDLGFSPGPSERAAGGGDQGPNRIPEFRQMMRAEKLDRMLRTGGNGKVGIMKLRLLSSGGARREKRSLLLGGKTDYSGSAVVEVALYDADGTMRASEVFSYHTGFRKFKTNEKQPRL
jgi:hypothetical protein